MTERAWRFGDVIRVDPAKNPRVPQPDDRRWVVVSFDDRLKWTLMYLGPSMVRTMDRGVLSHWSSVPGFIRVEDDE